MNTSYQQTTTSTPDDLSLRQARRQAQIEEEQAEMESAMAEEEDMTFRQQRAAAKKAEVKIKKKERSKMTPTKFASARLLKSSWIAVFTGFGLIPGLFYLNIHAFSRMVMPSITCRFGAEWMPLAFKSIAGEMGKSGSRIIGFFEVLALLLIDLAVLMFVLSLLMIALIIIDFFTSGWIGWFFKIIAFFI
jgi:hypothetical protein